MTTGTVKPKATVIVIATTMPGRISTVSTIRCTSRSNHLPKYALAMPSTVPIATPMSGAIMPTNMDTRPPCSSRLTTSRPSSSLPNQSVPSCSVASANGGSSWRATVLSYLNGDRTFASSTIRMITPRIAPPAAPVGCDRPKAPSALPIRASRADTPRSSIASGAAVCCNCWLLQSDGCLGLRLDSGLYALVSRAYS